MPGPDAIFRNVARAEQKYTSFRKAEGYPHAPERGATLRHDWDGRFRVGSHLAFRQYGPGITAGQNGTVPSDDKIATHSDPVWRDRANFILRADLTPHGMPGSFEQFWTRKEDEGRAYRLCCIPFFTYGIALGDVVIWDQSTHSVEVLERSGRRCLRVAFEDKGVAKERHQELHRALAEIGPLAEFKSDGYGAIDIEDDAQAAAITSLLIPWQEDGSLIWEWAN